MLYVPAPGRWLGNDTNKTKFCRLLWILGACQAKTNTTKLFCKAALGYTVLTKGTELETSSPLVCSEQKRKHLLVPRSRRLRTATPFLIFLTPSRLILSKCQPAFCTTFHVGGSVLQPPVPPMTVFPGQMSHCLWSCHLRNCLPYRRE